MEHAMETLVTVSNGAVIRWNKEQIEEAVKSITAEYENVVYTDDTMKQAKEDRAKLRKLSSELDDKRKFVKSEVMKPYNDFEKELKSVLAMIDTPVTCIDTQVKAYEESQKEAKKADICKVMQTIDFRGVDTETFYNPKWLNASYSMTEIQRELKAVSEAIAKDLDFIDAIVTKEYRLDAIEHYKATKDFHGSCELAKKREALDKKKALAEEKLKRPLSTEAKPVQYGEDDMPIFEDNRETLVLRMKLTTEQKTLLMEYINKNNIECEVM